MLSMVAIELYSAAYKSRNTFLKPEKSRQLLKDIEILPFDLEDDGEADRQRKESSLMGRSIVPYDILTTEQERSMGLTLQSNSAR